jgi:hypothetical protein
VRTVASGVVPTIPRTVKLAVDGIGVTTDAPGQRTSLRGVDYEIRISKIVCKKDANADRKYLAVHQ